MRQRQPITWQAGTRLLISLCLFVIALSFSSALIYNTALKNAAHERAENLEAFYKSRLAQLENDWEVQTLDFKARIEFTRYLEDTSSSIVNLQAFFTIQGGERRFTQLLVQDKSGKIRFKFSKDSRFVNPLKPSDRSGWYRDTGSRQLYRLFQESIWLGKDGTGKMVIYFPIDNALLYKLASPDTVLAAKFQNELVSSSLGSAGLDNYLLKSDAVERKELPWSGEPDSPLKLLIDAPVNTIFSKFELMLGVGFIPVIDALILWFALGTWLMLQARRIKVLGMAVGEFVQHQEVTLALLENITLAQGNKQDEIHDVSVAVQSLALQTVEQRLQHIREESEIRLWSSVFKSSAEGIIITDRDSNIVAVNPAFLNKTGYFSEDVLGKNPRILSVKHEKPEFYVEMWRSIASNGYWQGEVWNRDKEGIEKPYLMSISSVYDAEGSVVNYVAYYTDISDRIRAEEALKHHRDNLEVLVTGRTLALEVANQKLIQQSNQLIAREADLHRAQAVAKLGSWTLDVSKNRLGWSDETYRIFGLAVGTPMTYELFLSLVHTADRNFVDGSWQAALQGGSYNIEHRIVVDGATKWVREQAELVFDLHGNLVGGVGTVQDITELKQYEQKIEQMAYFDALTQLPNRRMLYDRLSHTIANGKRNGLFSALIFIDLDNFKPLNDQYGHVVGDLLLREVARRLTGCVRETDTVARFGGDEFVVLLCELDRDHELAQKQTAATAEKIRNTLALPYWLEPADASSPQVEHECTPSIGVAMFAGAEASMDEILTRADTAMYRAKEGGRNQIRFYDGRV